MAFTHKNWISTTGLYKMIKPEVTSKIFQCFPGKLSEDINAWDEKIVGGAKGVYSNRVDTISYCVKYKDIDLFQREINPFEMIGIEVESKGGELKHYWYFKGQFDLFNEAYNLNKNK